MNRNTSSEINSIIVPLDYPYFNETEYSFAFSERSTVIGPRNIAKATSRTIQPFFPLAFLSIKALPLQSLSSTLSLFSSYLLNVLDEKQSQSSVCSRIIVLFYSFRL